MHFAVNLLAGDLSSEWSLIYEDACFSWNSLHLLASLFASFSPNTPSMLRHLACFAWYSVHFVVIFLPGALSFEWSFFYDYRFFFTEFLAFHGFAACKLLLS